MSTRVERLDALQQALDNYVSKEKTRIENEVSFLKAVLKGRTGQETISRTVDVISEAGYKDMMTYLFGNAEVVFSASTATAPVLDETPDMVSARDDTYAPASASQDAGGASPPGVKTVIGWSNGKQRNIQVMLADFDTQKYLSIPAANAYILMKNDAARSGVKLLINLGFRTFEEQKKLYEAYRNGSLHNVAAKPGYSNHQMGIAADIHTGRAYRGAVYDWLRDNAARFKFKNNVAGEPWHWEYQG